MTRPSAFEFAGGELPADPESLAVPLSSARRAVADVMTYSPMASRASAEPAAPRWSWDGPREEAGAA